MSRTPFETPFESAPLVEVMIEIPRWSFLKVGSTGQVDFVSPFPCPFNYGCVPRYVGLEGDLLDAVVLGPRLARGTVLSVRALAAVGLTDRGLYDDKLICCSEPITRPQAYSVGAFFRLYARCKALLNAYRGRPGRNAYEGWGDARSALARAKSREPSWSGPRVPF
ncbi:MAG TPA: inorganic diphosphatase [Gammaproteobacteria bacterium]|nr:inorganic diphosphatase [Gammaproteobacteria bacterium]